MRLINVSPTSWRDQVARQHAGYLLPFVCLVAVAGFIALPGALDEKTHQALHGLCAQRPSHSYWLGDARLPFDARMTGIYGGGVLSLAVLAARGRLHAIARPRWPVIGLLATFVAAMAVDGTNSLLLDMGTWHPYEPRNEIRLITGSLTGVSLAATLCFLISATFWRTGRRDLAIVESVREIAALVALTVPFGILVALGPGWLYAPIALFLLGSAVVVVGVLAMVMSTIATRRDGSYRSVQELGVPAAVAVVLAVVAMAAIAGGRFWLENTFGVPPLQ
jgi:uncharacterized membrane protein